MQANSISSDRLKQRNSLNEFVIEANLVEDPLVDEPCPACSAPTEIGAKFCVACGTPLATPNADRLPPPPQGPNRSTTGESPATAGSDLPDHLLRCQNCGSQVATTLDQRSYTCPFCDSSIVTEIDIANSGRQRPEFVIGFAVTAAQAQQKYYDWLGKNAWFRPGDLATKAVSDKQKGVYIPFWHFSMLARSRWSARIGEYWYREERYQTVDSKGKRVTRTRRVQETEWFPLRGEHHKYYHSYLVPGSKGITPEEAKAIQPFQLSALQRYRPYYLAGWMAEEYTLPLNAAARRTKKEFELRQQAAVQRFLPGDRHSDLRVQTKLDVNGSDLILLPVFVLSYRYRDRVYRFLVNGQTGKFIGEKPWSGRRVGAVVIAGVAVILILLLIAYLLSS